MNIDWKNTAPPPTDEEIAAFEREHNVLLTDEHRWFLQNVANGGRPALGYEIPATGCPGGAATLHGVYGIGRIETYYDLGHQIRRNPRQAKRYFPFGYDDTGGELAIDLGKRRGRLVYNPSDPDRPYHSADSIRHLLETLILFEEE